MRNGSERNYIVWILVFVFLVGNALLLSVMKELENNLSATFMLVFLILSDMFLVKFISESICKNKSHQINENNHKANHNGSSNNSFSDSSSLNNKDNITLRVSEKQSAIKINVTANSHPLNAENGIFDSLEKTNIILKEKTNKLSTEFDIKIKKNTEKSSSVTKNTYQSLYNILLALYNQKCENLYSTSTEFPNKEKSDSLTQTQNINKFEGSTDVPVIQKPYTKKDEPMSDFNKENSLLETFIKNVIQGEEEKIDTHEQKRNQENESNISWGTIELPDKPVKGYAPQKIVKKNPPIVELIHKMDRITIENELAYPKGFYSRYSSSDKTSAEKAQLFYKQALFMENVEDNYKGKDNSYSYWHSTFECMDLKEKRIYFTWRTHIRKGKYIKAKLKYILTYLSELINNIPYEENTEKRFDYFLSFVTNLDLYIDDDNTDYYTDYYYYQYHYSYEIKEWLISFYLLNDVPYSKYEFNQKLPEKYRYEENEYYYIPDSKKYSDSKELLNRYSNYKFLSSIFYESEYGYLLLEAIDYVFQAVEKYLKNSVLIGLMLFITVLNTKKLTGIHIIT